MKELKAHTCHGGTQRVFSHVSTSTRSEMTFAVFEPSAAAERPVPVLYFLSGLTCTWENFTVKAGAQRYAERHGLMLVMPDTSPRGLGLPHEDDSYDFGSGAGFYVDATRSPWAEHYRMYSYVTDELPRLVEEHLPADPARRGVFGHSMGGHGALVCALRNPERYQSVSSFSPICAPTQCPWGTGAFTGYLGEVRTAWDAYDASVLVANSSYRRPILVDQGGADEFLAEQLKPELLQAACERVSLPLELRIQPGYDHSYYFINTFIADHIAFHAQAFESA